MIDRRVLLGIGVGLMLGAVVTGTDGGRTRRPNDLEVIRRAKALGMVFAGEERLGFSEAKAVAPGRQGPGEGPGEKKRPGPRTLTVEIPAGATAGEVARVLRRHSLIADEREFLRLAAEQKAESRFQAGSYRVPSNITVRKLIETLVAGPRPGARRPE